MICIFSSSKDYSTTQVIKWLHYYHKDVVRINFDDDEQFIKISITPHRLNFQIDNLKINLDDITAVWFRKGKNWLCNRVDPVQFRGHNPFSEHISKILQKENYKLSEFIDYNIETRIPALGLSSKNDLNKLIVLKLAKEAGFNVPEFILTNDKDELIDFIKNKKNVVTKPLSDVIYFFESKVTETGYFTYTELVNDEVIHNLYQNKIPSFFQEYIEKQYEVRTFYLDGKCFSMAIMSQSNEQTRTDFRKYPSEKPNRNIPYNLPEEIELKTIKLFNKLNLNTGSIDFIVNLKNEFYFLEINPVGQFGMVSEPCNYYLEKKVAQKLIEYEKRQTVGS